MDGKVRMKFKDWGEGFVLSSLNADDSVWEEALENYALGDLSLCDRKGRIIFLEDTLKSSGLRPFFYYISEARRLNIPGRYEVPELGLKDATFVEVLEAVRDYYARKLACRSDSSKIPAAA